MSLYQNLAPYPADVNTPRGDTRTPAQYQSFLAGLLSHVNLFYGHAETWVVLATHAYRKTQYKDSDWPCFEALVSQMAKNANFTFDLPTALGWIDANAAL